MATLLKNEKYKGFVEQFTWHYSSFYVESLPQDKLMILDELGKIEMSVESLLFIRSHYKGYLFSFISHHIAKYIKAVSATDAYEFDEVLVLLETAISDDDKITLIELDSQKTPISVLDKEYSDVVCEFILRNRYFDSDINGLLGRYSEFGTQSQVAILERAENYVDKVLSILCSVDDQLISELFASSKVRSIDKQIMFKSLSPEANDDEIKSWLFYVNSENFLDLYNNRKRPKFEDNVWNKTLLDIFKGRKLFCDYEKDAESGLLVIHRRKKDDE